MKRSFFIVGMLAFGLAVSSPAEVYVFDLQNGFSTSEIGLNLHFNVQGVVGDIADIDVRLSIRHPDTREISAFLFGRALAENVGNGANFQDTLFDMDADGGRNGEPGFNDSPFSSPEWGGRKYRPQSDWADYEAFDPNQDWWITVFDLGGGSNGYVFAAGEQAPWGSALGTQLIITTVPEPATWIAIALPVLAVVCRRSVHRKELANDRI